jgi:hypothetical protein
MMKSANVYDIYYSIITLHVSAYTPWVSQFIKLLGSPVGPDVLRKPEYTLEFSFFFNLCGGTLGTAATTGLLYQPRMIGDGDCGEIGGMKIGRGNRSTRRKPAPSVTLSTTNPT